MHSARRPMLAGMAALVASPALAPAARAQQGNELRLGALYPFSGNLALLGDESFRGLELATEERNAAAGVLGRPLRLLRGDATDQPQAAAEARRLTGIEKVVAMFGSYASPISFAATQVAELQGTPYFELGAISDQITERGFRALFRTCPRASDFGREAVNAVAEALAPLWRVPPARLKVALLHEEGLYGTSVAGFQEAQLRERGLTLAEKLSYPARAVELVSAVQRLKGAAADVVLHTGYQNDIMLFYRAMQEVGWRPRMVVGAGAGYSLSDTALAVGPEFDGTMNVDFTQFEVNERVAPGARPFVEAYRRKYGSDPRSGHSLANYFGARVCLEALHRAGATDKDKVRQAMLALDVPEGSTATGWGARFDEKGQNTRCRPFLLQWQGGRQLTVLPSAASVAELRPKLGV